MMGESLPHASPSTFTTCVPVLATVFAVRQAKYLDAMNNPDLEGRRVHCSESMGRS